MIVTLVARVTHTNGTGMTDCLAVAVVVVVVVVGGGQVAVRWRLVAVRWRLDGAWVAVRWRLGGAWVAVRWRLGGGATFENMLRFMDCF